jgi:hypothetical protein
MRLGFVKQSDVGILPSDWIFARYGLVFQEGRPGGQDLGLRSTLKRNRRPISLLRSVGQKRDTERNRHGKGALERLLIDRCDNPGWNEADRTFAIKSNRF